MNYCLTCVHCPRCGRTKDEWCASYTTKQEAREQVEKADELRFKRYGEVIRDEHNS